MTDTIINLTPAMFGERERVLVESGELSASTFLYESGVCGLRLRNAAGETVLLPFQGQQIWSVRFGGRELAMKSIFTQPYPTRNYLETYGGFLIHCGATAMGVPTAQDNHPLHGELPNAPYGRAWVTVGDDDGPFISLSGEYQHRVFFNHHYSARPEVRLHAGATVLQAGITIENLKHTPMELMYLAHANFRPIDHGRLVYSAVCDREHVRVRRSVPSHVHPAPGYVEFLDELSEHPEKHNVLTPGLSFDPEVVFFIEYLADQEGWAHSLQVHPDGSADYIAHRPDQLNHANRWISRTPDQDTLGLVLPATAETEGYTAEKAKGNVRVLAPGESARFDMLLGYLDPPGAAAMADQIRSIVA